MTEDRQPVLHGSSTSPFVRKVRLCLMEKDIAHRFELASAWRPDSGLADLNPLCKVPVLRMPGGPVLYDSRVIVQYAERCLAGRPLLPTDPQACCAVLQVEALADGIGEATSLYVQEGWRKPDARSEVWRSRQADKIRNGLRELDRYWRDRPADGAPDLAALASGAALGFADFWLPDLGWQSTHPGLEQLWRGLERRPSWAATAPHLPAGSSFPAL